MAASETIWFSLIGGVIIDNVRSGEQKNYCLNCDGSEWGCGRGWTSVGRHGGEELVSGPLRPTGCPPEAVDRCDSHSLEDDDNRLRAIGRRQTDRLKRVIAA